MESHGRSSRDVISVVTARWLSPVLMPLAWKIVVFCKYQSLLSVLRPCYQSRMSGQCPTHLHVVG